MENTEVEQQWEQQEDDDKLEEGLITRRKNIHQTPLSITINAEFSTNHGTSIDGEDQKQETKQEEEDEDEDEDEEVKDFSQQNGIKVDQDEKQKEKLQISDYCVYYDTVKGTGLHRASSAVEANGVDSTAHGKSLVQENTDVKRHNQDDENGLYPVISKEEHQKHDNFSDSNLLPSEISFEMIKDGVNEITDFDVETVLKKQDTHDLYCPNCNSCITKRVILRKRKRRIPTPGEDAKRNKPETFVPSEVNVVSDDSSNDRAQNGADRSLGDVQPTPSIEYDHQRDPDVFRCLSCFSIFMPTGNGFKLFRMFGNKSDEENNQRSHKEVRVKKHWFSSIFASDKVEPLNNQGAVQSLDMEDNVAGVSVVSSNRDELNVRASPRQEASATNGTMNLENEPAADYVPASSLHEPKGHILEKDKGQSATRSVGGDDNAPSSTQGSVIDQLTVEESNNTSGKSNGRIATDSPVADTHEELLTSYHVDSNGKSDYPGMFVVAPPVNNVGPAENPISPLQHDGLKLLVPPNVGSLIIDNSQMNQELDVTVQMNSQVESTHTVPEASHRHMIQNNAEIHLKEPLKVEKDVLTDKQIQLFEDLKDIERIKGKDTIITIETKQPDVSVHQRSPETLGETRTPALQHDEGGSHAGATSLTGGRSLDVVKSIVYGGLMESIASLSVVSSAAGADAATLNVFALGLANIFGGLFVITHDLWDLKNECTRGSSNEAHEQEDRYQQLLGLRADFPLHMVVSLLSYLVFGFIPPVVFGFSFRESNDRDLKLLMVGAASVMCIVILAAGKTYVQRPHKSYLKTIVYYVVFGFMVSGASYLFGDLIMKLLEKMNIFHSGSGSGSGVNLGIVHGASSNPDLATY